MATVYPLRLGKTNTYIVRGSSGCILVDAGPKGSADEILSALRKTPCGVEGLKAVVLTHTHYDHARSLAAVCSHVEVDVIVHKEEAAALQSGYTPLPRGTSFLPKLIAVIAATFSAHLTRYIGVAPTVEVDEELDLSDYGIDGRIIHTPGHTAGSVSVLLDSGQALVGDTLFHFMPGRIYPPFANLPDVLLESWRKLLDTGATVFYPSHGSPISREQLENAARQRIPDL